MSKGTTIKDALKLRYPEVDISQEKEVKLLCMIPPIEKMDSALSSLTSVEKLSLSTNCIEKISALSGMSNLRILSLGRNNIKKLEGLDNIANTLEQLWMSYNSVEKLKNIEKLKNLKTLYITNNLIKDWHEFDRLQELTHLEDLTFVGNPLYTKIVEAEGEEAFQAEVKKRLPNLKRLDGKVLTGGVE